ncbi:hypothetical protein [Halostagnicola sp. A56]|uniref:hypothetical protein n=1 Tax=Halostagnicola sp. A56 TaxID=1495067 RepID=UPI0012E0D775|nr:hypothetical protein [Halostagnicola sp. A56]
MDLRNRGILPELEGRIRLEQQLRRKRKEAKEELEEIEADLEEELENRETEGPT